MSVQEMNRQSRRALVKSFKGKVRKELLPIEDWVDEDGQHVVVEIRSLTGGERADYMSAMAEHVDENGRVQRMNFRVALGNLAFLSTFDPETGERIFDSPDDALEYDAGVIQTINDKAQELSGLNREEEEVAGNV